MDLYYPTLTFVGSTAAGTNSMIVAFGGSNSTIFPSLFASGQRRPGGIITEELTITSRTVKERWITSLAIVASPT